jgi:hypothetical protein
MRRLIPLSEQEQAAFGGMTHMAKLTFADPLLVAQVTANTAQAVKLATMPKGSLVNKTMVRLVKPFKDASDAAYDTTTFSLGDTGSATRFHNALELNENGAEITDPAYNNTAYGPYTADSDLIATFGSKAGKKISDLDNGEVHIFVQVLDTKILSDLK